MWYKRHHASVHFSYCSCAIMKSLILFNIFVVAVTCLNVASNAVNRGGAYLSYPQCIESNVETLWPDFNDNRHYYACIGLGFSKRMHCQDTLMFSFQKQVCVYAWEWETPPSPSEIAPLQRVTATTHLSSDSSKCQLCWRPDCESSQDLRTLWPDYDSKEYYFECIGQKQSARRPCPRNTVFSSKVQVCVWPNEWAAPPPYPTVSTHPPDTTTISTTSTTLSKPTSCEICWRPLCDSKDLQLLWPDFDNKHFYFKCLKHGEFIKRKCLKKLQFNFYTQKCENAF